MKRMMLLAVFLTLSVPALGQTPSFECEAEDLDLLLRAAKPLPDTLRDEPGLGLALLVGINEYNSDNILPPLAAPKREIQALEQILKDNNYVVKTLFDAEATYQNLKRWLTCLGQRADTVGRVLFYFAGHAGNLRDLAMWMEPATRAEMANRARNPQQKNADELLLCLRQSRPEALTEFVLVDSLTHWLSASPAHQQIVWIDACYSGNLNKMFQLPLEFYTYRSLNDGFFALTGVKDRVFDGQYGKLMLRGLRGEADTVLAGNHDGRVSLYEVSVFIDHHLRPQTVAASGIIYKSRYILVGSGELYLTRVEKNE